jgi:hypothetical protein
MVINPMPSTLQDGLLQTKAEAYWLDFDAWLFDAATRPGATLASVSSEARGAFPSIVAERLLLQGFELEAEAAQAHESSMPRGPELHAAEFEWYFTEACATDLARFLRPSKGKALVMGAPTVARAMQGIRHTPTLVDRSPFLDQRFGSEIAEQHRHDLRWPLGRLRSHEAVFFDAPWHEDHISRWLWQASLAVRPGGTISFALFGDRTRPAARTQRVRLLELASVIGKVDLVEDALHYDTPLFEAEALAAAGIEIRSPWRHGDLVLIEDAHSTITAPPVPAERTWRTILSGTRVIKLQPGQHLPADSPGQPTLHILDTVSRSRIRGIAIGAWTSRNEIAAFKQRHGKPSRNRARAF